MQCQACKTTINDMLVWTDGKPVCYACYIAHKQGGTLLSVYKETKDDPRKRKDT